VRLESANGAANATSPLVKRNSGVSAFVGLTYSFWVSDAKAPL
jgi:outer membrane scaffolding protein for murein synthesis (MipA/OmpV family)